MLPCILVNKDFHSSGLAKVGQFEPVVRPLSCVYLLAQKFDGLSCTRNLISTAFM